MTIDDGGFELGFPNYGSVFFFDSASLARIYRTWCVEEEDKKHSFAMAFE